MPAFVRYALVGLVVVVVQWLVLKQVAIWGAYPDAVLLYVAWLSLRNGKRVGAIAGFSFGFLMDLALGTLGLHTLVKTLVGFLVGLFPANERETLLILPRQAFLGSLIIALLHNGLVQTLVVLDTGARNLIDVGVFWIGGALYTAFLAMLAALFGTR